MKLEKLLCTNFYALDTETTGFDHNELIQVAVVLFINGEPVKKHN